MRRGLPSRSTPPRPVCGQSPGTSRAYLLVLAQCLRLARQARSFLLVRLIRGGDLIRLRPRPAAHLAAGPRGLVNEGAARALPAHLGAESGDGGVEQRKGRRGVPTPGVEWGAGPGAWRRSQGRGARSPAHGGEAGAARLGRLTGGDSGVASGWPRPGSWGTPGFPGAGSRGPRGCSVRSLKPRSREEGLGGGSSRQPTSCTLRASQAP